MPSRSLCADDMPPAVGCRPCASRVASGVRVCTFGVSRVCPPARFGESAAATGSSPASPVSVMRMASLAADGKSPRPRCGMSALS
eukprot:363862-Chlamydomonas_euryale.AAC.8